MTPRVQPPRQPDPVVKMLVRYGKVGPARFASHRDFARAFERALRRADIPMAYSSGFNPHQRVSYINPAATGVESDAEFLVIALAEACEPGEVARRLSTVMPVGLPVLDVTTVRQEEPSPLSRFGASLWEVRCPGATWTALQAAVGLVDPCTPGELYVTRDTKTGPRRFDVRGPLEEIVVTGEATLTMVIRVTEPLVRPDDVCLGMREHAEGLPDVPLLIKRLAQGTVAELIAGPRP